MSTPAQTPPTTGPKGAGGKLAGLAGNRKTLLLAAAVGTALVAFVMSRGGQGGASGGSDQQMTGYDSTSYDQYNAVQSQLEDIQKQIDEGKVVPGTPVTPTPTPASPKPTPLPAVIKPTPKPVQTTQPGKGYVTIKRGDTLSAIAKRAGISMTTLKKLNPVFWTNKKYKNGSMIWSGGKVRVK